MRVVALLASPRKEGNTALLMQHVLKKAESLGAQTQVFYLNGLNIRGCQSCFACKADVNCAVKDDAGKVLDAIKEADSLVFATPVYMWDMTAQLKNLVDRLFSFMNPDFSSKLNPGKKVLWAITQGQPDETMFLSTFEKHGKMLQMIGFKESKVLIAGGLHNPGEVLSQVKTLNKAEELGAWLVQ